jgi:CHAD domain-containing protein
MAVSRRAPSALLLQQRVTALRRMLPGARSGDVRALHQARVATRRLREALPLVGAGKAGRRLERVARALTGVLGTVRELDVALLMLDELARTKGAPSAAVACLRRAIGDERGALQRVTTKRIDQCDMDRLQRKALQALERRSDRRAHPVDRQAQVAAARRRAARRAARLEAMVDAAGAMYLPDRLHQVRIAVKKLRYALEIARDLSGSRAEARIRSLKRVQDLLGRMHDLEVLIARTRGLQAAAVRDLQLSSDLDQLVRRLENEARQLHGHYIGQRRALLELCNRVITAGEPRKAA